MNFKSIISTKSLLYWIVGALPAYFLTSYSSNFYEGMIAFVLLSLFFQTLCGIVLNHFPLESLVNAREGKDWMTLLVLAVAASLPVNAIVVSRQFPGLFDRRILFMDASQFPVFVGTMVVSVFAMAGMNNRIRKATAFERVEKSEIYQFLQKNVAGIVLASLFFLAYFTFTQSLNFPGHYTRDQYFETDISDWIANLTTTPTADMKSVRAVHPAVMLFLKPLTWLISIPLNENKLQAAFALNALAGSACVFVAWMIVRQRTGNTSYALIVASLLGAGTSHLLLSSMLETYIYSGLALISFCYLLQSERTALKFTIPMGVVIFGITITNLAQACILYFLKKSQVKLIFQFIVGVLVITLALNVWQAYLYPNARLLLPSNLTDERTYQTKVFETPQQAYGRVNLIGRAVLLYGIVAPQPYILSDELGTITPNFRTFRYKFQEFHVAGYKGLGDIAIKFWIMILGFALIRFFLDLITARSQMTFSLSLALCLGFNFILHIFYGDDPMLYTPNWMYALILFVSVPLEKWAHNKWLQCGLVIYLVMIIITNTGLIHQIMGASLPFYGR